VIYRLGWGWLDTHSVEGKKKCKHLANMLSTSAKGNVYDENRKFLKPAIVRGKTYEVSGQV
jgi:hypothetical protein